MPSIRQNGQKSPSLMLRRIMPQDPALTLGDLVGKVRMLRVECGNCGRIGTYSLRCLVQHYGREQTILDWKDQLTADCPRRVNGHYSDQCRARCPDLLKVL